MQWRMLQEGKPEDFVMATGRQESFRRFFELSAQTLGWGQLQWEGSGLKETSRRSDTGAILMRIDPRYFRPAKVETLLADPSNARENWAVGQRLSGGECSGITDAAAMSLLRPSDRIYIAGSRGVA